MHIPCHSERFIAYRLLTLWYYLIQGYKCGVFGRYMDEDQEKACRELRKKNCRAVVYIDIWSDYRWHIRFYLSTIEIRNFFFFSLVVVDVAATAVVHGLAGIMIKLLFLLIPQLSLFAFATLFVLQMVGTVSSSIKAFRVMYDYYITSFINEARFLTLNRLMNTFDTL